MIDRIVYIGLCLLIAAYALIQGVTNIMEINASADWIQIEASVDSIGASGKDYSYSALIFYQFEIEGKPYKGHTLTHGTNASYKTRGWALQAAQELLGEDNSDKITIYYDPDDPESSVILRAKIEDEWSLFAICFVSLLIAYGLHLWYLQ